MRPGTAPAGDWARRIGQHLLPDGAVVVPPRVACWLEQQACLTDQRRISIRDTDPGGYEVLAALHLAALTHRSGRGTKLDAAQPIPPQSEVWLTTAEAAEQIGCTARAVRKWCANGRLPATRAGGRWLINGAHLNIHKITA